MRHAGIGITLELDVASGGNTCGDFGRAFGRRRQDQVGGGHRRDFDAQVDAIDQRARNPHRVIRGAAVDPLALAGITRLIGMAAAARVQRRDQHEARRIGDRWLARDTATSPFSGGRRGESSRRGSNSGSSSSNSTP
jgi:hypothetical protein